MASLPKIRLEYGETIGVGVYIKFPALDQEKRTYLSDDMTAGTSVSVLSGADFSNNDYAILGTPGIEHTEIVQVSSSTSSTVTLGSTSVFAHNRGDSFKFIPYNQIVIERSTDGGSNYSTLATVSIRADATETYYLDTTGTSAYYYRAKFYNATSTNSSQVSDVLIATGFTYNQVGAIKSRALDQMDEEIGGTITDKFLNESLWEARREVDNQLKRWSWRTAFNTDIGNIAEGMYSVSVPSTLRNPDSPQNILSLKNGIDVSPIRYLTKREYDAYFYGVQRTTVATQPSVGATSIVLANVRDLNDSGSVRIGSNTVTYTSKDNTTATLSGVPASGDGSITATHAVGTNVWQNAGFGSPDGYTIFEDTIYFNRPFESIYEGANIFADYYRKLPEYDSDSDTLDEPDVDMYVSYLKHKIAAKKAKEKYDRDNNPDYKDYINRLGSLIRKETINQTVEFVPDIGHLVDEE